MLITRNFVMINFPKTGSTFARTAILKLHPKENEGLLVRLGLKEPSVKELIMPQLFFTDLQRASNPIPEQHAGYVQLPRRYRDRTIMSVVRDPLKRIISIYEFRSWERKPFPSLEILKDRFPHFPDLAFEEFLEMFLDLSQPYSVPEGMRTDVGPLTRQFIRFYARDPLKTMLALRDDTDLVRDWDLHFPKIEFLHTENLNSELHAFLLRMGYVEDKIAFIKEMDKVNTSKRSRKQYVTPALIDRIRHSERHFFRIFPEYLEALEAERENAAGAAQEQPR